MAKPFKLRISKVTISLQFCNSKDTSTLPLNPVRSFLRKSPVTTVDFPAVSSTAPSTTRRSSSSAIKRHVLSAFTSVGCGFTSRSASSRPQEFEWRKEEKWLVAFPVPPPPPSSTAAKNRRRVKKKKSTAAAVRISRKPSGEETETLVSSTRSFSTDSSVDHKKRSPKRGASGRPSESEFPARLSAYKKLIPCSVEGKVRDSFAIVKKSRDPYEDFKRSMMEMIVEKEMFEKRELEQMLECLLSLNAREYHGIIVGAFSEIWEDLFYAAC